MRVQIVKVQAAVATVYQNPRVRTVCQFCGRHMIEATACVMCEKLMGEEIVGALRFIFFFLH